MTPDARKAEIAIVGRSLALGLAAAGVAGLAGGSGVLAGLVWAGAYCVLHLVFGAGHAHKVAPDRRLLFTSLAGAALALISASAPTPLTRPGIELGLALSLAGGCALVFSLVAGRALMLDPDAADGA